MLTARSDEDDSLMGYELGADDYLIKPYSPRILMVKVKRFLEKYSGTMDEMLISSGGIVMNIGARLVTVDGNTINYGRFNL
jgi:DNA-binding response OmpR family regulator